MTCSQLLTTIWSNQRRCSIKIMTAASATKEGTTKRGIVTRSLPSMTPSYSSTSSPTRVLMSPLILHQNQGQNPNLLFSDKPKHQKHDQQQQRTPSVVANVVEYSTQHSTSDVGGSSSTNTTNATTKRSSHKATRRRAHSHAAHRLVAKNKKPTASGWKKPIVSSSLALSSFVEPTSPNEAPASVSTMADPISPSASLETTTPPSASTVGVDMEELLNLASKKTTPLSLKDMYKYAIVDADNREQRIRNAQFLHSE
jgi:hypothetical protein